MPQVRLVAPLEHPVLLDILEPRVQPELPAQAQPARQVHPALSALAVGLPAQPDLLEQPAPAAVPLAHPVPQVRRERVGLPALRESELQAPQGLPVDRLELRVPQVQRVRLDSKDRKVH